MLHCTISQPNLLRCTMRATSMSLINDLAARKPDHSQRLRCLLRRNVADEERRLAVQHDGAREHYRARVWANERRLSRWRPRFDRLDDGPTLLGTHDRVHLLHPQSTAGRKCRPWVDAVELAIREVAWAATRANRTVKNVSRIPTLK